MKSDQDFDRMFRQEFKDSLTNVIWQDEDGVYEAFNKYKIYPEKAGYRVMCYETEVGTFSSSRSALSWCIADKNSAFNTARELLEVDSKLSALKHDIATRAAIGDNTKNAVFKETILVKLESKLIRKKLLENRLANCVNWAKYVQQRGFDNETQRIGRGQPNKTNR